MSTELFLALAVAGVAVIVGLFVVIRSGPLLRPHVNILTLGTAAVIIGGDQALENSHLSHRAHGLWLSGTVLVFLLGIALVAHTRRPPKTRGRDLLLFGALIFAAIFASLLFFGKDPTDLLFGS